MLPDFERKALERWTSQTRAGAPPDTSSVHSAFSRRKAMRDPSGDQRMLDAPFGAAATA
jgi:hypothetical protein